MSHSLLLPVIVSLIGGRVSTYFANYLTAKRILLCPVCKKDLHVLADFPILGHLLLCPNCNTRRPVQFTVELLCLTWTIVAYIFCPSEWFQVAFLSTIALVIFRTDWEDMVLYDDAQLALGLGAILFRGPQLGLDKTIDIILWAVGAGLVTWCFELVYKSIKGHSGLGNGDPLLVTTLSLWLSPFTISILLAIGPLVGCAWTIINRKKEMALGAFLTLFAPLVFIFQVKLYGH